MKELNENKTTKEQLMEYRNNGYVLHGSKDPNIRILEPKESSDVKGTNPSNNDTAIYATKSPAISIAFAIMNTSNVPEELKNGFWSTGDPTLEIFEIFVPSDWKECILENKGYIYVLEGKNFIAEDENSWQLKSKSSETPIDKIEVTFKDFIELGGKISWK